MTLRTRPVMRLDVPYMLDERLDYVPGGVGRNGERLRVWKRGVWGGVEGRGRWVIEGDDAGVCGGVYPFESNFWRVCLASIRIRETWSSVANLSFSSRSLPSVPKFPGTNAFRQVLKRSGK